MHLPVSAAHVAIDPLHGGKAADTLFSIKKIRFAIAEVGQTSVNSCGKHQGP